MLWPDTFTNHFEPDVGKAAVEALEAAGFSVIIPEAAVCCGRPLYEYGMLERARQYGRRNLEMLRGAIAAEMPVVVLEPSCLSVFKDEMHNLFADDPDASTLARNCYSLDDFLVEKADYQPPRLERLAMIHGHCHQKALGGRANEIKLLKRMGIETHAPDTGCCGLAGSFGYEAAHYDVSMKIGEHVLLPEVRQMSPDALIVTSGFSCRAQIAHGTGRNALHPAQVVQMALREAERRSHEQIRKERRSAVRAAAAKVALGVAVAACAGIAFNRQMQMR